MFHHCVGVLQRAGRWLGRTGLSCVAGTVLALGVVSGVRAAEPVAVVASFSILGDMVKVIGGDQVTLTTLIGPGGDAHAFDPAPADMRTLATAKVLVTNGLGFEGWMPRLVKASGFKGKQIVASEGVKLRNLANGHDHHSHDHKVPAGHHDHDHHDDHKNHAHDHDNHDNHRDHTAASGTRGDSATVDPHAWQDLENGVIYARNIARGLAEADPANAAQYQQRADQYVASMRELHAAIGQALQAIPSGRRRVVTPHDAFGYFDQAYGVTFVSAAGLSSDAEPSAKDIARLVRDIKASASTALFTEGVSGSGRVIEQVARETGLKVGGPLFSDSLAEPGQPADTYLGMFRWNADQIISALQQSRQ